MVVLFGCIISTLKDLFILTFILKTNEMTMGGYYFSRTSSELHIIGVMDVSTLMSPRLGLARGGSRWGGAPPPFDANFFIFLYKFYAGGKLRPPP